MSISSQCFRDVCKVSFQELQNSLACRESITLLEVRVQFLDDQQATTRMASLLERSILAISPPVSGWMVADPEAVMHVNVVNPGQTNNAYREILRFSISDVNEGRCKLGSST